MTYNLAVKLRAFNRFRRGKKVVAEAKRMAEALNEKRLIEKVLALEESIADKNRNLRDYVSEMGMDMPAGHNP